MTSGIYCYKNKINGKKYVGQSQNLETRMFQKHKGSTYLLNAIEVYGMDNFEVSIVEECEKTLLNEREKYWIKELSSHVSENGYNISWGGNAPMRGRKHTQETRDIFSKNRKGEKHPLYGKHHSIETIEKIRQKNTGKKLSTPTIEKIRINSTGRKHTEEAKEKVRRAKLGVPRNTSLKEKVSLTKTKQGLKNKNSTSIYYNIGLLKRGNCIRWRSSIKRFGFGEINIGSFKTEVEAAIARDKYVLEEKLNRKLNFPRLIHFLDIYFLFLICDLVNKLLFLIKNNNLLK